MKNFKISLRAAATRVAAITLTLTALTTTFTSCGDPETPEPDYTLQVIDFEAATLNADGRFISAPYEEKGVTFTLDYTVNPGGRDYWSGFVVSDNTDKTIAGLDNQFSVYGNGGVNSSKKFAVSSVFGDVAFQFAAGTSREVEYAYFTNTTYDYLAIKDGNDGDGKSTFVKGPFEAGDWFKLTITGYDAAGKQTATTDIYLADYRNGKSFVMSDWTKIELLGLGEVNKVSFALSSSDNSDYGGVSYMNTPGYFCIDNIAYRVY